MTATPHTLSNIEDGYATVLDGDTGSKIGHVHREKVGSTRTGTAWFAVIGTRQIGSADTRTAAVAIVCERIAKAREYKMAQR